MAAFGSYKYEVGNSLLQAPYGQVSSFYTLTRLNTCCHMQPLHLRGFDKEVRNFVAEQYELHGLKLHPEAVPAEIQKGAYMTVI